jgi:hypothetical protein
MQIGRKIYFDKATGNVIIDTGERQGSVVPTTVEQDIAAYTALSERNRDTFDVIELPFGALAQDFAESSGYNVNIETGTLEFQYRDQNEPDVEQPFRAPLSQEVEKLKQEDLNNKEAIAELYMISMGGF